MKRITIEFNRSWVFGTSRWRPTTLALLVGWSLRAAFGSLCQDYFGLEGYVAHVREHWVDAAITVPLALVLVALCVWAMADARKREGSR